MNHKLISLILLSSICSLCTASDIRDKVKVSNSDQSMYSVINPDEHIFGMKYGAAEDEFISKHGKPDGYIQLDEDSSAMIYGKRIAFIFQSNKLQGVRISSHSILDWNLSKLMTGNSYFDNIKWKLNNGIREDTHRGKVREILGETLVNDNYSWYYATKLAKVTLRFSHYTGEGDTEEAYKVHSVTVRKK